MFDIVFIGVNGMYQITYVFNDARSQTAEGAIYTCMVFPPLHENTKERHSICTIER